MISTKVRLLAASMIASVTVLAPAAQAVTFDLINLGGAGKGTYARQGFDIATAYWSSVLTDDVVIHLEIGFNHLGDDVLGATGSNSQVAYLPDVYNALAGDVSSAIDQTAVSGLAPLGGIYGDSVGVRVNDFNSPPTTTGSPFDVIDVPGGGYTDERTRFDDDSSSNNAFLDINTANLKALGFTQDAYGDPIDQTYDGSVLFSSDLASTFDFDPTDGIAAGHIDFVGVAIHEIGHALGFISGVDTYDVFSSPGSPVIGTIFGLPITYEEALRLGLLTDGSNLEDFAVGSTLDLFRYNADGELDWSTSDAEKMFSLDGSTEVYGDGAFSLGMFNGDGEQASHWLEPDQSTRATACSNFLGIMNPYICTGLGDTVTGLDIAAMDAIGWDIADSARDQAGYRFSTADAYRAFAQAVPEPATWLQMIVGAGFVGGALRLLRRRRPAIA